MGLVVPVCINPLEHTNLSKPLATGSKSSKFFSRQQALWLSKQNTLSPFSLIGCLSTGIWLQWSCTLHSQSLRCQSSTCKMFLATFDVEILYTIISWDQGITALESYLQDQSEILNPLSAFICDLVTLILKSNFFSSHQREYFLRVKGTLQHSYANLYLGNFEQKHIFNEKTNPFYHNIIRYYRYLDDVLCLFKGSQAQLSEYTTYLNTMSPDLAFSVEIDSKYVHFLWYVDLNRGGETPFLPLSDVDRSQYTPSGL